jgi:hypothetical protein
MSDLPKNLHIYTTEDAHTHLDADGKLKLTYKQGVHIDLEQITSIGIANLFDVASHTINDIWGSTSHVVRFHDGGSVQFSYSHSGELLEFSGNDIAILIQESTKLMVIRKFKA